MNKDLDLDCAQCGNRGSLNCRNCPTPLNWMEDTGKCKIYDIDPFVLNF